MKKLIYKGLYEITSLISNRFNIRLLTKFKLYLGIALLVIVGSCSKKEEDESEVMCYDPPPLPQESAKIEPVKSSLPTEKQLSSTDLQ